LKEIVALLRNLSEETRLDSFWLANSTGQHVSYSASRGNGMHAFSQFDSSTDLQHYSLIPYFLRYELYFIIPHYHMLTPSLSH